MNWLKYVTWALTALLPLSETFFHNWAIDIPGSDRKKLTPYGKAALALTLVGLALSLFLTVRDDRAQAQDRDAAERNASALEATQRDLKTISDELIASKEGEVAALTKLQATLDAMARLTPAEAHKQLQATTQQTSQALAAAKIQATAAQQQTHKILAESLARKPVRVTQMESK
jgi:hypothetical protein